MEAKIPEFYASYVGPQIAAAFGKPYAEVMTDGNVINYHLQSIRDVYLRSNFSIDLNPTGDIVYVYLFIAIALFILLLACINFMNLSTARASTRAMEVGIRKVVGSDRGQLIAQILILLSRDFTKLVLIAIVLAIPIAYLAMNRWMEGFVYRTDIHVSSFILAGILALLIAWLTVSFQTIRAAKSDPIKSLRYE
ncbi:MAG: hypothetical protein IH853_04280 [Bacteroidetes bacterium]|nr:hypothetical protein [Bacteroidota bacterium]